MIKDIKTILVTGGAGFIGSNFIHYILNKYPRYQVVNLDKLTYCGNLDNLGDIEDNSRYQFVKGDICDKKVVDEVSQRVDIIINFAAETHVDRSIYGPLEFVKTNVLGTAVLLEAARKNKVGKFLQVSSDEVYGELPLEGKEKFTEERKYYPRSPYSASKGGSDHLVYAYSKTYGMQTIITNCSNNLGPYQYPEKFVPLAITNVLEGKPIRVYGEGKNRRDWIWVYDHCRGIEAALGKGKPGETYLFGGKEGARYSNFEVAKMILSKMGAPEDKIEFVKDRPGHDLRYDIDWSKAKRELGWEPEYDFERILEETIKWYKENQWWWKPLKKKGVVVEHGNS